MEKKSSKPLFDIGPIFELTYTLYFFYINVYLFRYSDADLSQALLVCFPFV